MKTPFDTIFRDVAQGRFDMVAASASVLITEERKKKVDFSLPYFRRSPLRRTFSPRLLTISMDIFFEQYFDLTVMWHSFGRVLLGFWMTIQLSLISGVFAMVWGLVLALCRTSRSWAPTPLRLAAVAYIDVFRGIPLLLVVPLLALDVMRRLAEGGMTMVVVTHEMSFAKDVSDEVLLMGGVVVVECGDPTKVFTEPSHERTQRFLDRILRP
jgi:His/Glu/Gln/Arg/opine family amino acid ABC transporter permease subunit